MSKWLLRGGGGFEKIRETAYQFVSKVVARYAGRIRTWCVVSGLNAFNHFGFRFEQIVEMTRAACIAVKTASDRGLKIVEITNPWGEYYAVTPDTIPPLVYMDMVVQSGVHFDAFGLQIQLGKNQSGMHVRDMMQISSMLDVFGPVGKPLYITHVEVPSAAGDELQQGDVAGIWHGQWDQPRQAEWIEQFYKVALSKSFVDTVTYASLADSEDGTISSGGLLSEKFEPKQSFRSLKKLHDSIFSR